MDVIETTRFRDNLSGLVTSVGGLLITGNIIVNGLPNSPPIDDFESLTKKVICTYSLAVAAYAVGAVVDYLPKRAFNCD